ncbi:threonine--tRNA ligase [bacterium]|jgi:threonyl-tRNA synthetase|nr:threonine--tRNA ligase [bacterium]
MAKFPLETIRHSAAHVLAQAVLHFFPTAQLGIGPAIENGFYYDFDLETSLTDEDLNKIEQKMEEIIKENQQFTSYSTDKETANSFLKEKNQTYKLDLIDSLDGDSFTFFENGPFVDLCKGPHVEQTREIGAIKLLRVSGAYWRGSEKNPMLQRIYGTAFSNRKDLKSYLKRMEEAKKRDHRLLGKTLDLFSITEEVGGGLVLWHPKGALIRHLIESYWKTEHLNNDYDFVLSPHVGKADLWEKSGHLSFYEENMFSAIDVDDQKYYVKPMNCPFHILVYKNKPKSYRELPIRYAELGTVYRYERSGVLHGLLRVRGFTQDDAHIICTEEQMKEEIKSVTLFTINMLKAFGFEKIKFYLATRPDEKYVGEIAHWKDSEDALEEAIKSLGLPYEIDHGGGAFYGPKIDVKIEDAIGREWQCSTIQFDFNLPERFDMTYIGQDGEKHRPYMIHRAIFGSLERFFGVLVEHYEGNFPVWLAPTQVSILTVNEKVSHYAKKLASDLKQKGVRVDLDTSSEKIGYKIRKASAEKIPYMFIVGDKEVESNTISVRRHQKGDLGVMTVDQAFLSVLDESKTM